MLIQMRNISKKYGERTILSIDDLKFEEGKIYGLVGKNGAGKTTLFRMLAGLTFPTTGEIEYEDAKVKKGVIIEQPSIDLTMNAVENLKWAEKLYGHENCRDIDELLKLVNLHEHKEVPAKKYSLGMKQRLGIAMCLIHQPKVLILDEPMNGLDPEGIIEFRHLLQEVNAQGTTILISSHILDELYKLATEFVFIKDGEVVKQASAQEMEVKNTSHYELITSDNEKAVQILNEGFLCQGKIEGDKITFSPGDKDILDISKTLAQSQIYITMLFENRFNIEDYYMEVLGDND